MKTLFYSAAAYILVLPSFASAQGLIKSGGVNANEGFGGFVAGLTDIVNNFLIPFLIALAVLGFIYGVFQYFILGSDDEEKRGQGRSLMLYAIIGFVAIVALWGIVNFVVEAFGFGTDAAPATPTGLKSGG